MRGEPGPPISGAPATGPAEAPEAEQAAALAAASEVERAAALAVASEVEQAAALAAESEAERTAEVGGGTDGGAGGGVGTGCPAEMDGIRIVSTTGNIATPATGNASRRMRDRRVISGRSVSSSTTSPASTSSDSARSTMLSSAGRPVRRATSAAIAARGVAPSPARIR